jgi:hypothetical protein
VIAARRITFVGADPSLKDSVALLRRDSSIIACQLKRVTENGNVRISLTSLAGDDTLPRNIQIALTRETRRRLVSQLPLKLGGPNIHIEIRIFECTVTRDPANPTGVIYASDVGNGPLATSGDALPTLKLGTGYFRVEMRNTGKVNAHVALIDLNSEGGIGAMWPNPDVASIDNDANLIPAAESGDSTNQQDAPWIPLTMGKGQAHWVWRATEPAGVETFVAIATPQFADFGPLFDMPAVDRNIPARRGPRAKDLNSPLGRLFASYAGRRGDPTIEVANEWQATAYRVAFVAQ